LERDAASTMGANLKAAAEAVTKGQPLPTPRPPVAVPPTAMSGERQVVDLGGMDVEVLFLGRAHTGGDLHVLLPKQRILFMSEAFLNRVFPAMRSAYPSDWVATIDRALALPVDRFIPGHGFIETAKASREELVTFQAALKAVIAETRRLHALGLRADAAVAQARWGPYGEWFLAEQQAPIAIAKIYEEIDGTLR